MARRRNMMDRRAMRVMAARSEAFGCTISSTLRSAIDSGDPLAILLAVGTELRNGAKLPASVVAWYGVVNSDPTPERVEDFARDVADVFVNCEIARASAEAAS
jgi:hypothetical protein